MTASLAPEFALTDDELLTAADRVGVQGFPTVLAIRPRHGTITRLEAAFDGATTALTGKGLITDGAVHPDLVCALQALERPDRELAMRLVTPDGMARVCVVRRGADNVLARRIGNDLLVRMIGPGTELGASVRALTGELPRSQPAEIEAIGAPLDAMSEALADTGDPAVIADRIRALGASTRAAMLLGSALASRQAFAEIVYYALAHGEDRVSRGPAAVGIFYTKRGRIVAAPSASPVGQLWTTLKAGSDHAVTHSIARLVELSDEGWEDP